MRPYPLVANRGDDRRFWRSDSPLPSPVKVAEIELADELPMLGGARPDDGQPYRTASVIVRLHHRVLDVLELEIPPGGLAPADLARELWGCLGSEICRHLVDEDGLPAVETLPPEGLGWPASAPSCGYERDLREAQAPLVSVVVSTCGRPSTLAACLDSLLDTAYPDFELLVVDNLPSDQRTAAMVRTRYGHDPRVLYVSEPTKGSSAARNRGLAEASSDIVVFTDDDVIADRHWLPFLVRAFVTDDRTACVTGMVTPRELDTPAQLWFEQYGGFNKGHRRGVYDNDENRPADPLYPYAAGSFGTGACMAFRTQVLRDLGGFSENLGLGTPATGGEDLDAFTTLLLRDHRLVYEPDAIVRHAARRDIEGLFRQIRMYGVGLGAMITKQLVEDSTNRWKLLSCFPRGIAFALSPHSQKNAKRVNYPRRLSVAEIVGMLSGPGAYFRSRRDRAER